MIPRSLVRAIWLPILLLQSSLLPFTEAEEAIITLLENPAWSYRAELADFGYILDQRLRYNANFMTPPMNETQLCSFPNFALSDLDRASRLSKPVALLVSLGGCETGQKVAVALEIHKKITNFLRFIVFYNNDPNNPDEIFKVNPPINTTTYKDDLDEMSFSAVSTGTSSAILAHMQQFSALSGKTSNFLGPSSDGWMLEMIIETAANPFDKTRTTTDRIGSSNFYWFRIVLFALLVLSPFCRAIFLWWTGGGRIRLRRNENRRIVGFLYTPPMAYWFVSHGTQEAEPVADIMTREQVMALPEIVFKPPPPSEDTANDTGATDVSTDDSDDNDALDKREECADDGRLIKIVDRTSVTLHSSQPVELSSEDGSPRTTCTSCSICIDDFEAGEKIRLLPCGHAFHTECILPWLTRRQGCCPMCKKSVMGEDEDEESNNTAAESAPFSRCLENSSGVDTIEESATRSVDRSVAAGDAERSRGNNGIGGIYSISVEDPEAGTDQVVNAVVNGFDSPSYDTLSNGIDIEIGEGKMLLPDNDDAAASVENSSNVESGLPEMKTSEADAGSSNLESNLPEMEESGAGANSSSVESNLPESTESEADADRVESSPSDDVERRNGNTLPEEDISLPLKSEVEDAKAGDKDQNDSLSATEKEMGASFDEREESVGETITGANQCIESSPTDGEDNPASVKLSNGIKSTTASSGDPAQVDSATELEFQQSSASNLPKQETAGESSSSSHSAAPSISEAPIANDDQEVVYQDEPQIADTSSQQSPVVENDKTAFITRPDSDIQDPNATTSDSMLVEDIPVQGSEFYELLKQPEVQETGDDASKEDLV